MLRTSVICGLGFASVILAMAPAAYCQETPTSRPAGIAAKVDLSQPGAYRSGLWEYRLVVTSPGSKSEGTLGKLYYNGKPVEDAVIGDYYRTPWGDIQWVGNKELPWGAHGWSPREHNVTTGGRLLPEPWILAGGPVVMAMVLTEADATPASAIVSGSVKQEMQKLGVKAWRIERDWFPLNDQFASIHDTKMLGTLTVRLCPARSEEKLTVLLGGTCSERIELPRKNEANAVVCRPLGGPIESRNFYLAFRVDRAAPDWPRPVEIGLESDGKEVVVKNAREVVISLPGDKRSGLVWKVKRIQGDAPLSSSVKEAGEPQFVPSAGASGEGVFENVLRVSGTGKSYVELEYGRPWQADKPAEKTWKVTLDVHPLPSSAPAK